MGFLPDELWTKILGLGIENEVLSYRDVCSLAFVCRRTRRISTEEDIWRSLWERDRLILVKPFDYVSKSWKDSDSEIESFRDRYRVRFAKVRAAKLAAHQRHVLRAESQGAMLQLQARQYELAIEGERSKLAASVAELKRIELACRSSTALQIWQPEAVRFQQHVVLRQESVNVHARQISLQMEVNVCRERVLQFERSLQAKRRAIEKSKRDLEALISNPFSKLDEYFTVDERADRKGALKRKRDMSSASS